MNDALLSKARGLHQAGQLAEAARLYGEVLRAEPRRFEALYPLGLACLQRGEYTEAERAFAEAALIHPHLADLHGLRGAALSHLGRHEDALAAYDRALAVNPVQAATWNNRGTALFELGRHAEAVTSFDRALSLKGDHADAWRHRALALTIVGRFDDALASFDKAIALQPHNSAVLEAKGNLLMQLNRHAEAEKAYAKAVAIAPGNADLHYNHANALSILTRYHEAIVECGNALAIDPDYPFARGVLIHSKLQSCDWRGIDEDKRAIDAALKSGKRVISSFNYKALSDCPKDDLECARVWISNERPAGLAPLAAGARYRHGRIRLAYVSADFNLSAVATAMAGVFEQHDHTRFETFAISFGGNTPTAMRARLRGAFDHFLDLRDKSDGEIAAVIRDLEIDIAVDLMGYTGECRSWILARRPAPVQVNYLGFAGSMGSDHIDYILADRFVIPEESRACYAEKVVYLPHCYLPHDSSRAIADDTPKRSAQGLPEQGFVFASFNNAYKFSRPVFEIWMLLLAAVPDSVLWLSKSHPAAMANLAREAESRGISARRLVFASPIEAPDEHLARLRLADLFLDTLPYNAHSTAMDALWAGVPVLTAPGNSFQGRVAASLLNACELPEMIVPAAQYEAAALHLARNPDALSVLRKKLADNRNSPLFDTARFTRGLEAAFAGMSERHARGDRPESFAVPPS